MAGRNPNEAFRNYIEPVRDALSYITQARLTASWHKSLAVNTLYTVALNDMDPVPLKGTMPISLSAGQIIRIVKTDDPDDSREPFEIQTVQYFYDLLTSDSKEILGFHWTPEERGDGVVAYPHLHVGSVMIDRTAPIRPTNFHKAHIPTGRVSMTSIVRLTIDEFGVTPLRIDWQAILGTSEADSDPTMH